MRNQKLNLYCNRIKPTNDKVSFVDTLNVPDCMQDEQAGCKFRAI